MSALGKDKILPGVNKPEDLKPLNLEQLGQLAQEVRELIIRTVSRTGGHLAANLGTVELTIALLKVFDPPHDKLVWDVSHQTYTYKILTERKDVFHTLRQTGGISGFLRKDESPYDIYGAGHAGTALSAALGIAVARDMQRGPEHVVAVVGDGALGCGSSFEALNNIAAARRLIVVLNDNKMSIAANVGSFSRYLGKLLAHPKYNRWKAHVEHFARKRLKLFWLRHVYFRLEEAVKSLFLRNILFEEFGLRYVGPIDGHDLKLLVPALEIARNSDEPILLHVNTQKGKGYPLAEEQPEAWHGTGAFEYETGKLLVPGNVIKYSNVFGQVLERLAGENEKIVAITAAMSAGTGLTDFSKKFPSRFFDVGISEEHAVIFAAGLAVSGYLPVVVMYSTFAQRVVDFMIHDVCLQNLPVILCLDRAGLVGDDGPTHHGVFDIALFRAVPNLVFMQPKDEAELAAMLKLAVQCNKPVIIRYPRGSGPGTPVPVVIPDLPLGKAEVLSKGRKVQIWGLGDMLALAQQVADRLNQKAAVAGVVNPRFIRPLDMDLLREQSLTARVIVTIENGVLLAGFGSAIGEVLQELSFRGKLLRFGWPDRFIPQGSLKVLSEKYGLTAEAIADAVLKELK